MIIKKYVLLVDEPEGRLARRTEELKDLGYEVAQVSQLEAALNAIAVLDRLSLVVVNCAVDYAGHQSFMAAVRGLHPQLPVIWVGESSDVMTQFLRQPAAAARSSDPEGLSGRAAKLLYDEFYANDMVAETVSAAELVLSEFGIEAKRSDPYIKSNLTLLSDVNAIIGFSGEGLSGHLILASSLEKARDIHQRTSSKADPQYDELEDLIGEITNRVLGRIKRAFETRSLSFKLKPPSFIRGPMARYRSQGSVPSLAIEFADSGQLRLELSLDRVDVAAMALQPHAEFLESGEINFL
jgi:CheY-specific phosphatase CheX